MSDKIITPDENPFGQNNSIVDTRRAILMDAVDVVMMTNPSDGRSIVGLELGGRVNQTVVRNSQLFLFDADGVAAIMSELMGLVDRAGEAFSDDVAACYKAREALMPKREEQ